MAELNRSPVPEHNAELLEEISLYRDEDGYAVSWGDGGSWDHSTVLGALGALDIALASKYPPMPGGRND